MFTIYKITNISTQKSYVGITRNYHKRKSVHICLSKKEDPPLLIQKKIKQYGIDNFTFEILTQCVDLDEGLVTEKSMIENYHTLIPNGYNIHPGGQYATKTTKYLTSSSERMTKNNPARLDYVKAQKTSTILAKNSKTNDHRIISDRKLFSIENDIPYSSIGWAIRSNKELNSGWSFSYVKKRTNGI